MEDTTTRQLTDGDVSAAPAYPYDALFDDPAGFSDELTPDALAVKTRHSPNENIAAPDTNTKKQPLTHDSVRMYLKEIGRVPLLSATQEVDLAKRVEAGLYAEQRLAGMQPGQAAIVMLAKYQNIPISPATRPELEAVAQDGQDAKRHFTEANLRLVVSVAKKYAAKHNMPLLELVQEGNLGLIRAVEKFDYEKGYKFSTYATWWIRQAITRAIADQARTIRIPVHMVEMLHRLRRIEQQLIVETGREPTDEELAEATGYSTDRVADLKECDARSKPTALEMRVGDQLDTEFGDFIEDAEAADPALAAMHGAMAASVDAVLNSLGERERAIVRGRFGFGGSPKTLEELGKELGLTRERIRQIENLALKKLRDPANRQKLADYSDI